MPVIIDLTIKRDDKLPVGARHRLRTAFGKVDDCQPTMSQTDTLVLRIPLAKPIGATCSHVIANAPQLCVLNWIGSVMIGIDARDAAHCVSACSDAADALLWNHPKRAKFQTRQCGPNALQALLVAPLLYAREARLALTA